MQKNVTSEQTDKNEGQFSEVMSSYSSKVEKVPSSSFNHMNLKPSTSMQKIDIIRQNIIGFNTRYSSPFNIELESVYVDHTATNRAYKTV